jgi:hypothetical protein
MKEKYSTRGSAPLISTNNKENHNKFKGERKFPRVAKISAKHFSQWESYIMK